MSLPRGRRPLDARPLAYDNGWMQIALSGATGFAGQVLAQRLLDDGHAVRALVREPAAAESLRARGAELAQAELADPRALARSAAGCEVFVHAAAETHPGSSARALGWQNVAGTENALNAAKHAGVRRFVHLSCSDVTLVGAPRNHWTEDHVPARRPVGALARSKQRAEEAVIGGGGIAGYADAIETVVLRPGMLWGAGDLRSRLPALCAEGLAGGLSLCGTGTNLVATTHVDNLAEAVVRAIEVEAAAGGIFHVLDGELALAQDFFGELAAALKLPRPVKPALGFRAALASARLGIGRGTLRPEEVIRRGQSAHLSTVRAREILGFMAPTSMAAGFAALATWVDAEGGAAAIAAHQRAPLDDDAVAAQVAAASA